MRRVDPADDGADRELTAVDGGNWRTFERGAGDLKVSHRWGVVDPNGDLLDAVVDDGRRMVRVLGGDPNSPQAFHCGRGLPASEYAEHEMPGVGQGSVFKVWVPAVAEAVAVIGGVQVALAHQIAGEVARDGAAVLPFRDADGNV